MLAPWANLRAFGAAPVFPVPDWLARDVARKATWLPRDVKELGIAGAYRQKWALLPPDIQSILGRGRFNISPWMIALIPSAPEKQPEIAKQFRFMADLAGTPPANKIAMRIEQLLIFAAAAQLPTPGSKRTGRSLGREGCTAAISQYILASLKLEFPQELARMNGLADTQSSPEMLRLFEQAQREGLVRIRRIPFAQLRADDFHPGTITIAQKPSGTHVFGWVRVPAGWQWDPRDLIAVGNTGLLPYGDRMILAQEYVTFNPHEESHNSHGPINSWDVLRDARGHPIPSSKYTNVYAAENADFILIDFVVPPFMRAATGNSQNKLALQ